MAPRRHYGRVLVCAAVVLTTSAAALTPAQGRGTKPTCDTRPGTTLAANDQARVYRVGSRKHFTAYGCHYRARRVVRLGGQVESAPPHEASGFDFVLSGRFVAVDSVACDPAGCEGGVDVTDTKTGRTRHGAPVDGGTGGNAQRMVLKTNGSVAWTRPFNGELQVVKLDADGEAVIDRGDSIDVESLALAGSTLYWTNAGVPHSATLR
jgi:hypothetical protein